MNLRLLSLLLLGLISFSFAGAQTQRLIGKVYNEKNEPLAGVTVQVTGKSTIITNTQGSFVLNLEPGKYEISFSSIGYETKVISDVEVTSNGVNELNVTLLIVARQQEGVVVTARTTQRRETVNSLISFQKNTNTVASVISAEAIRRSPDRNTGEVLKRTAGASIQEGKFIVVRGLADRYNQAMLNGVLLTSTEPDRKTFSFDLIPAPMIDNIVINKAFVPEFPGEWAGGLIQVNTRDIPSRNFFNIQLGTSVNTQTFGKSFFRDPGGSLDWLGVDDGTRSKPTGYTTKGKFDQLSFAQKTEMGKNMRNAWTAEELTAPLNVSFQANGGFAGKFLGKNVGGTFGLVYNKTNRYLKLLNRLNNLDLSNESFTIDYNYDDNRYVQDVTLGALGSFTVQLNSQNRISFKAVGNLNSANSVLKRTGEEIIRGDDIQGTELSFRQNTFFTSQLIGEHTLAAPLRFKWYGSFNILDGYIPDQRRIVYTRPTGTQNPYSLLISGTLSQQSGSRIFQDLSDYIYTAGGDLSYNFNLFGNRQTLKGGYMLQVKDRLYDAKLFAVYLQRDNPTLRALPADKVFAPENFGDGTGDKFGFDAIKGTNFRYMANTILNAGFLQFDNQFSSKLRLVWGVRAEHFDQLVGSVKKDDPRHTYSKVFDLLPGFNATYKINDKTNLRFSGSQTVIRPELRELSALNLYDFELNASVQGNPNLKRTKITNLDLRYELYPRAGEVWSAALFYKKFKNPIEQYYNQGIGGASTFNYINPEAAKAYGVEVEFRKKLDFISGMQNFTFQGNGAYIYSRIQDERFNVDRPLQGQSPYLVNLGMMYDLPNKGFTATVLFNRIGHRIYLVGDISAAGGAPDIYEASRSLIDLQFSKKLLNDKLELRLNVQDLLNQTQYFYQNANKEFGFNKSVDALRFSRTFGTTFGITANYSL